MCISTGKEYWGLPDLGQAFFALNLIFAFGKKAVDNLNEKAQKMEGKSQKTERIKIFMPKNMRKYV